jgi:hypothetical protein
MSYRSEGEMLLSNLRVNNRFNLVAVGEAYDRPSLICNIYEAYEAESGS